ncbi:MAG: lipopolysaccharide biosynthesis protein [Acidobacteriales bacterium]|nr:lipopolysaccharide biosynthesis protein [Terriglobales bacterium]
MTQAIHGPPPNVNGDEDGAGLGLADIWAFVMANKRMLGAGTLLGGVMAAIVALLMPNMYTATTVIMPPQKDQSMASAILSQLGPLASAAGGEMELKSPSDLYVGLLGCRTIADRIIDRFQLRSRYRQKTATDTRAKLKSRSRFRSSPKDSLIRVEVKDEDPKLAAAMANAYVEELNIQKKDFAIDDAGQRRVFLQRQLEKEKAVLIQTEQTMKGMQSRTGVIQLDGQMSAAIGSVAALKAQITAAEVALERLRIGATEDNPEVLRREAEMRALRAELAKLTRSSDRGDPIVATGALPEVGLEYIRRVRDLKYHELLFELLSKQYEAARLDEAKASPDLQVVDSAIPADKKSGPQRPLITLVGCFAGAALGAFAAYVRALRVG